MSLDPAGIAVGVPTCGRPDALARCLAALAEGTARPGEVIVVDQDPSAASREVVEGATGLNARRVEQPRLGVAAARNLALALTSRPVLAVTDDDCAPRAGWVAGIAEAFQRPPCPVAVTGPITPLGSRPPGGFDVSARPASTGRDISGRTLPWTAGSGGNFAARSDLLRMLGGWDERLGTGTPGMAAEDIELLYRILRAGGRVRYAPAVAVGHAWQPRERRLASRSSYAFGMGAMCGLWLRRGDRFAALILAAYARTHAVPLARAVLARDRDEADQHARALVAVPPGLLYGLRAPATRAYAPSRIGSTAAEV